MIGALQVYASDARSSVGGTAVLVCLVLPSDQRWAVDVTHWTAGQHHLVDSHQVPQSINVAPIFTVLKVHDVHCHHLSLMPLTVFILELPFYTH